MTKEKSKLERAQERNEQAFQRTNKKIKALGNATRKLYNVSDVIQMQFDSISGIPHDTLVRCEKVRKIRRQWKQQAETIEADYKNAAAKNTGRGAAGVGAGIAVAALGPTAAMGFATTLGVASTGTAIASLNGIAATNAALAWLRGGTLAAGGGGIAAGNALLALAGPVGWTIAGIAVAGSGFAILKGRQEKNQLEDIFTRISERDTKAYELAIVELNERITRIRDEEEKLEHAFVRIHSFGLNYDNMSEAQQYEVGSYVNLLEAGAQLLVNPILGLQPKFTAEDLKKEMPEKAECCSAGQMNAVVSLVNLLYGIDLNEQDKKLFWKALKKNKDFMEKMKIKPEELNAFLTGLVEEIMRHTNE